MVWYGMVEVGKKCFLGQVWFFFKSLIAISLGKDGYTYIFIYIYKTSTLTLVLLCRVIILLLLMY